MTNFTQNEQRMNESIDNFTQTEYLVTFLTFIYSFIATQFFNGWGKWIQNIDNDRPSLNHILFSILCFVLLIDFWWISFPRSAGMAASLPAFFASLFSPIIFSVLAFNIFPRGRTEDANLTAYFYRRGRFMFAILALDFSPMSSSIISSLAPPGGELKRCSDWLESLFALPGCFFQTDRLYVCSTWWASLC